MVNHVSRIVDKEIDKFVKVLSDDGEEVGSGACNACLG